MAFLRLLISSFAPILCVIASFPPPCCPQKLTDNKSSSLILSPLTSYADQILSIHRTKTSAGFSLDIPLIMLTASILKIFYWPGARYDAALLVQAVIMVGVQALLLKVALDNRPVWRGEEPFRTILEGGNRPWGFWRV